MDNLTKEQRKKNMQNIRSTGTNLENIIKKALKQRKIYFVQHVKTIPGKPDFVFRRKKIALFIDSDFWHCNPERFKMPKSNIEYWSNKIEKNKQHDREINKLLHEKGWQVIRLWGYDIKKDTQKCIDIILNAMGKM